jgi:hypothetical protein
VCNSALWDQYELLSSVAGVRPVLRWHCSYRLFSRGCRKPNLEAVVSQRLGMSVVHKSTSGIFLEIRQLVDPEGNPLPFDYKCGRSRSYLQRAQRDAPSCPFRLAFL